MVYFDYKDGYDFEGKAYIADGELILDFGRNKGKKLSEIDKNYLVWLIEQEFPEDLLVAVEDYLDSVD